MSVVFSGIPVAIIVNYPLSSALCESNIDGGWPLVFYIPGTISYLLEPHQISNLGFYFKAIKTFIILFQEQLEFYGVSYFKYTLIVRLKRILESQLKRKTSFNCHA